MQLEKHQVVRITMRLKRAAGYFELGMVQHALECLDEVDRLGELGPFKLAVEMFRAEILRADERYDAAARALETAARSVPAPYDQPVWLALSMCYRQAGDTDQAIESLACARGAKPPAQPPKK